MTSLPILVSVGVASQPLRFAHSAMLAGYPGPSSRAGGNVVVGVPGFGAGVRPGIDPTPPLKRRIGSVVPWNAMTGTGRDGTQFGVTVTPATGATAANLFARAQPSIDAMNAPFDNPLA